MKAERYDLGVHTRGTELRTRRFSIQVNGSPLILTGASIRSQFRKGDKHGLVVKDLSVGSGFTVVNEAQGVFDLDSFRLDLEPGRYWYDIDIEKDNYNRTPVEGVLEIVLDVTR